MFNAHTSQDKNFVIPRHWQRRRFYGQLWTVHICYVHVTLSTPGIFLPVEFFSSCDWAPGRHAGLRADHCPRYRKCSPRQIYVMRILVLASLLGILLLTPRHQHQPVTLAQGENRCFLDNGGCEHICVVKVDGWLCQCREGYELLDDGISCEGEKNVIESNEMGPWLYMVGKKEQLLLREASHDMKCHLVWSSPNLLSWLI